MEPTAASQANSETKWNYEVLHRRLAPERAALRLHPLYEQLVDHRALKVFMEHHIFAVWDFMSLVKSLQAKLTSISIPWRPVGDPSTRRYINEIVLEEESDEDGQGRYISHFELYLDAMKQVGADTGPALGLIEKLVDGTRRDQAMAESLIPHGARQFNEVTFGVIDAGELHEIAAAFAIGREGLIPPMFTGILENIEQGGEVSTERLRSYLSKHIELDGEQHGPMARRLLESTCGKDAQKWEASERVARLTLKARVKLWDSVLRQTKFACQDQ